MSQNQGGIGPGLKKLEFIESLGPQKPSIIQKKRRFKSKRDSTRKSSSERCDHNCINHPKDENGKDFPKTSQTGRKRLYNEKSQIYFCSVTDAQGNVCRVALCDTARHQRSGRAFRCAASTLLGGSKHTRKM